MAQIFTSNQVNHVMVVNEMCGGFKVDKTENIGTALVCKDVQGNPYIAYRGYSGVTRSDILTNIISITATPASKMFRNQNAALITVNSDALNTGNVISGQDYILRLEFQNPIGISPDHTYCKHGVVHATSTMSASDFYKKMAKSLAINMSREAVKLVDVYLWKNSTTSTINTPAQLTLVDSNPNQTLTDTYYGIKIVEAQQEWILGVKQDKPIIFKINNSTINNHNNDIYWADVLYSNGKKITGGMEISETISSSNLPVGATLTNSHIAAELEYFAMGERADIYRNVGWPDVRPTKYIVNPEWAYGYDMVNIHYAYVGSNHSVQKSEKDLTLICKRDSDANEGVGDDECGSIAGDIYDGIKYIINDGVVHLSGTSVAGNVPEFDGYGNIVDSNKASSDIP